MTAVVTAVAPEERSAFIESVAAALDAARVEYVFLHGIGDFARDSDLDLAVTRRSLDTVDSLVRLGALGQLIQVIRYDTSPSRAYTLRAAGGARYRHLDVACDPHGTGRYGRAISVALACAARSSVGAVPTAAAETLYLATKRAAKGIDSRDDARALRAAFARDPRGAVELLEAELGAAGAAVAEALSNGADLHESLRNLRLAIARHRNRPEIVLRRAFAAVSRAAERAMRPTGICVTIVGPDGVGKSAVAAELERRQGAYRGVDRLHLGPSVLPPPGRILGRSPESTVQPHARIASSRFASAARVTYLWGDRVAGWLPRVAAPKRRTRLVILERGWDDLAVDPVRYRLQGVRALVELLGRLGPRSDLTVLLVGPPPAVNARKEELSVSEIRTQLAEWRRRLAAARTPTAVVDTTADVGEATTAVIDAIEEALAKRCTTFAGGETAIRSLGSPSVAGRPHRLLRRKGTVRWVTPEGFAPGPSGLARPTRTRDAVGWRLLSVAAHVGLAGELLRLDVDDGLRGRLEATLGTNVELTAIADRNARGRAVVSVRADGTVVAYAKIADGRSVAREAAALEALGACDLRAIVVPRLLDIFSCDLGDVLVTEALTPRGRAGRGLGSVEISALAELSSLHLDIPRGTRSDTFVHGDFAPWNSGEIDGRLALWDWEDARFGLPFEDLFHWEVKRLVLLGRGTPRTLVKNALRVRGRVADLASRTHLSPEAASLALRAVVDRERAREEHPALADLDRLLREEGA